VGFDELRAGDQAAMRLLAGATSTTPTLLRPCSCSSTAWKNTAAEHLHSHLMFQILSAAVAAWGAEPGGEEEGGVATDGDNGARMVAG
jgi:hypothetical protein